MGDYGSKYEYYRDLARKHNEVFKGLNIEGYEIEGKIEDMINNLQSLSIHRVGKVDIVKTYCHACNTFVRLENYENHKNTFKHKNSIKNLRITPTLMKKVK